MLVDQSEDKYCGICWNLKENTIECIVRNRICMSSDNIHIVWNGCNNKICLECYNSLRNYTKCPFCNMEEIRINDARLPERIYPNYLKKLQMLTIMLSLLLVLIFIFIIKIINNNFIDDKFIIFIAFVIIITNIFSIILDTLPNIIGFLYLF